MLKLGNIILDVPFFQASLSGYSDYAMRRLAREFGSPLTFSGVMLAKSVPHPKVLRNPAIRPGDDEHPIGAQLLGEDPAVMAKAAKILEGLGYDIIDLNFACPSPKVVRRRRGGFLLNNPKTVIEIYRAVRQSVSCPVLMKLRTGFDSGDMYRDNFWEIASQAVEYGVDALLIHPRTVRQRFTGFADWQVLAEIKKRFPQTIIVGSGDLFSAETITENLQNTGIDGAVIARGAVGNPWIFSEMRAVFDKSAAFVSPTIEQQGEVILRHYDLVCSLYEQERAIRFFRKFVIGYCKRHPLRKKVQKALFEAQSPEQFIPAVKQWYGV